jgi:hypothetical protein
VRDRLRWIKAGTGFAALGFALYRTYAVPSIGELLASTGESTHRTQKRYDDTALLLDAIVEHGAESEQGRTAIRRVNRMHRSYPISDDDLRYVLSTFVVVPKRWLDDHGWRRYSEHETRAAVRYYQVLGQRMGVPDIPATFAQFEALMDDYERRHFGWSRGGRAVADATLGLLDEWYRPLGPVLRAGRVTRARDSIGHRS